MSRRPAIAATIGMLIAALVLSASSASATTLTSPTGTKATPTIKAASEGHIRVDLPGTFPKLECSSAFEASVESHGEEVPAAAKLIALSFSECTNTWHVTVLSLGKLEIKWTSNYDGTVLSTGATIQATHSGVNCRFSTNETTLGTIKGGSPATIELGGAVTLHSGSFLCGSKPSEIQITGNYVLTSPTSLFVDGPLPPPSLTSPTGTFSTPAIEAESEGHVTLDHPIANIQCVWAFKGSTESHNTKEGTTVPLSSLSTSGCTESWHGTTVAAGKLTILRTSGYNGKVTWTGATVEMTRLGTTCRYKTENTTLGTLTGGSPATIDIEAKLPLHSGSPLCGEEAYSLTGSLKVTSPSSLYVDG